MWNSCRHFQTPLMQLISSTPMGITLINKKWKKKFEIHSILFCREIVRTVYTLLKISECAKNFDVKQSAECALCRRFSLETLVRILLFYTYTSPSHPHSQPKSRPHHHSHNSTFSVFLKKTNKGIPYIY